MTQLKALALLSLIAVAGCTRNTVIVIAPQAVTPQVDPACHMAPTKVTVTMPGPAVAPLAIPFPARAAQAGIRVGCAGVFYRIGPDGHVIDPHLAVESPMGFDFGQTVIQSLAGLVYAPRASDPTWHYLNATLRSPGTPPPNTVAPRLTPPIANPFHT